MIYSFHAKRPWDGLIIKEAPRGIVKEISLLPSQQDTKVFLSVNRGSVKQSSSKPFNKSGRVARSLDHLRLRPIKFCDKP